MYVFMYSATLRLNKYNTFYCNSNVTQHKIISSYIWFMENYELLFTIIGATIIVLAYIKYQYNKIIRHFDEKQKEVLNNLVVKIDAEKLRSLAGNSKGDFGRGFRRG